MKIIRCMLSIGILTLFACSTNPPNLSSALLSDEHSLTGTLNISPKAMKFYNENGDTANFEQSITDFAVIFNFKPIYVYPAANWGNVGMGLGYKFEQRFLIGGFMTHPLEGRGFDFGSNENIKIFGNLVVWHSVYTATIHKNLPLNNSKNELSGERRLFNSFGIDYAIRYGSFGIYVIADKGFEQSKLGCRITGSAPLWIRTK